MALAEEPTLGEVIRRLEDLARQLANLAEQMQRDRVAAVEQARVDRAHAEETFQRRDVYIEARNADQAMTANLWQDLKAVEKDRESDVAWRRQVMLAVSLLAITTLVTIAIALSNLLAR